MSYTNTLKLNKMTNLETTFVQAVKELMDMGLTQEEAKKEVKFLMNAICDILEK